MSHVVNECVMSSGLCRVPLMHKSDVYIVPRLVAFAIMRHISNEGVESRLYRWVMSLTQELRHASNECVMLSGVCIVPATHCNTLPANTAKINGATREVTMCTPELCPPMYAWLMTHGVEVVKNETLLSRHTCECWVMSGEWSGCMKTLFIRLCRLFIWVYEKTFRLKKTWMRVVKNESM